MMAMSEHEFAPHYDPSPIYVLQGVILAGGLGYLLPALTAAEPITTFEMGMVVVGWSLLSPISLFREVDDGPGALTADDLAEEDR